MSLLEFKDLRVIFGGSRNPVTAVDGVNLSVPAGTVVGLVGESGSGKSTIARAAVGLVKPSSGSVLLDGVDISTVRRRRLGGGVQMVFQDPFSSLNPRMTIGASIAEALPRGTGRSAQRAETCRLLDLVGLDNELARQPPSGLSGGQRQRVALARALASDPRVLIADEITSALDVSVQGSVLNLVREVQQRWSMSVLFISHNLATVRYLSDVIAVMNAGKIVEFGPTDDVVSNPQNDYTATLLAAAPRMGSRIDAASVNDRVR